MPESQGAADFGGTENHLAGVAREVANSLRATSTVELDPPRDQRFATSQAFARTI